VTEAAVAVDGQCIGRIGQGVVVLLGVASDDTAAIADELADKVAHLRIFNDEFDKMNRSLMDVHGSALVVSQFTLLGDCRKGRRPSFVAAAPAELAESLYGAFADALAQRGVSVATGRFRAMMQVSLVNDGPVTLILDHSHREKGGSGS
jgi:D-tyrosyl-tRNA(Tyr) deacylase